MSVDVNGTWRSYLRGVANGSIEFTGDTTLVTGQWYYCVVTFNGSYVNLYLDGVSDATPTVFYMDTDWYCIVGDNDGVFKGFKGV